MIESRSLRRRGQEQRFHIIFPVEVLRGAAALLILAAEKLHWLVHLVKHARSVFARLTWHGREFVFKDLDFLGNGNS